MLYLHPPSKFKIYNMTPVAVEICAYEAHFVLLSHSAAA